MKTLIFSLVLMLFAGIANAQEITELKEAKVDAAPLSSEVIRSGNNFTYKVQEAIVGEFEKDPVQFVKTHFDIRNLISEEKSERSESYFVTFKSKKGNLQANFNSEGELVRSTSKFKNIALPRELRHQLYNDHKGWIMVNNVHITRAKDGMVDQNFYKVKLENGKERKYVTFEAPRKGIEVASK